ncbi:hypothetical protein SCOCK_260012 [Actinacidiphila cocklensis]|uniref:Uncharacterized protein n=1 Tax=Actinacidiphila cocklensis TaxID=887465 RepID=A0A9W4DQA8_9ACTN|nr:hypothetical protein SCOCK_260012 [Actinacidiphila cocklensis]
MGRQMYMTMQGRAGSAAVPDGGGVAELADAVLGQLPAVAGALDAAEGQRRVRGGHAVEEHPARLQVAHEAPLLVLVGGPHVGTQAERRVVGQRHRLAQVPHPVEGGDRAEGLLAVDAHRLGDPGQHGRLVVPAGRQRLGAAGAAQRLGAPGERVVDQLLQVGPALLGGQRADVGGRGRGVADPQGAHRPGEALGEVVVYVGVDDEALGRDAGLAVVLHPGGDRDLDRPVEVGGGRRHHHEGVAAAEFQHRLLDLVARDRGDRAARALAAGEGRGGHPRVAQDTLDRAGADQQGLEAALGEAGAVEQLAQVEGGLRDVGRVLEQPDVAGHQRGRGEPDHLPEREVPRHHREHHPQRAVADVRPGGAAVLDVGGVGVLVGEQALGAGGVPAHRLGALGRLRAGGDQRLAHLGGHGAGDLVPLLVEQVGGGVQQPRPGPEVGLPPAAECALRGGDPLFDALRVERVEGTDRLPGRGVHGGDRHAAPPRAAGRPGGRAGRAPTRRGYPRLPCPCGCAAILPPTAAPGGGAAPAHGRTAPARRNPAAGPTSVRVIPQPAAPRREGADLQRSSIGNARHISHRFYARRIVSRTPFTAPHLEVDGCLVPVRPAAGSRSARPRPWA